MYISATLNEENGKYDLLVSHLQHAINAMASCARTAPLDIKFAMPTEEAAKIQSQLNRDIPVVGVKEPAAIEVRSPSVKLPDNGRVEYSLTYNHSTIESFIVTDSLCGSPSAADPTNSALLALGALSDHGAGIENQFLRWENPASAASAAAVILCLGSGDMVPSINCRKVTQALMQFAPEQRSLKWQRTSLVVKRKGQPVSKTTIAEKWVK